MAIACLILRVKCCRICIRYKNRRLSLAILGKYSILNTSINAIGKTGANRRRKATEANRVSRLLTARFCRCFSPG